MGGKHKRKYNVDPLTGVLPIGLESVVDLVQGTSLCPDRIKVLLHQIYTCWIFDELNEKKRDRHFHKEGWVNLSSIRLSSLLTANYSSYEKFLEDHQIIEIKRTHAGTKSYVSGVRCTPYRINPTLLVPINRRRFKHERIHDYKTLKAIQLDKNNFQQDLYSDDITSIIPFCTIHKKMEDMLSNFHFDTEGLSEFVSKVATGQIKLKRKSIQGVIDAEMVAYLINDQSDLKPIVCAFGERFHTSFTRLPREYREFLRIKVDSEPICSVDISNCQPFLVSLIISHPQIVKQILPEFTPVLDKIAKLHLLSALQFDELCSNGAIYEFWLENRHDLSNRDEAKDEFIKRILFDSEFRKEKKYDFAKLRFKILFPDVAEAISIMKNVDEKELPLIKDMYLDKNGKFGGKKYYHKTISAMCQRLESRILTGLIVPALIKNDLGPFLTIHDSVLIPESKSEQAKNIFVDCFIRLGIKPPHIKIDTY
jgi:hypothetical protein